MKLNTFLLLCLLIISLTTFFACSKNNISKNNISSASNDIVIDSDNIISEDENKDKDIDKDKKETNLEQPINSETPIYNNKTATNTVQTTVAPAYTENPSKNPTTKTTTKVAETAKTTSSKKISTSTPESTTKTTSSNSNATEKSNGSTTEYLIIINKSTNKLNLYKNKNQIATYPVATGRDPSLTPEGKFTIVNKAKDPSWKNSDGKIIPGGTDENPLGDYWLGLSVGGGYNYGLHGTNNDSSIGTYASGGCIRMYNSDIAKVYSSVPIGSEIWIGTYSTLPNP